MLPTRATFQLQLKNTLEFVKSRQGRSVFKGSSQAWQSSDLSIMSPMLMSAIFSFRSGALAFTLALTLPLVGAFDDLSPSPSMYSGE